MLYSAVGHIKGCQVVLYCTMLAAYWLIQYVKRSIREILHLKASKQIIATIVTPIRYRFTQVLVIKDEKQR